MGARRTCGTLGRGAWAVGGLGGSAAGASCGVTGALGRVGHRGRNYDPSVIRASTAASGDATAKGLSSGELAVRASLPVGGAGETEENTGEPDGGSAELKGGPGLDRPGTAAARWSRVVRFLREGEEAKVAFLYLGVRAVLLVAAVLAAHQAYRGDLGGPFTAWDSHFYLGIARSGYPPTAPLVGGVLTYSPAGFPPVFPMLIRTVAIIGIPEVGAGIIVSVVAGWVATMMVYRLGSAIGGEDLGYYSALLFMVFPGMGVSWGMIYSESAGTALVAWSLWMMKQERWAWAGALGALATATNPVALALAPAALVPAVQALRRHRFPMALLTAFMTPLGLLAFAVWEAVRYHDLLFYWHLQHQAWGVAIDWGNGLIFLLPHLWQHGYQGPAWLEWISLVAVIGAAVALSNAELPGFVTTYTVAALLELALTNQGLKVRLLTWAFPALIAVAATAKARTKNALVLLFMGLVPIVFLAYATLGNTMSQP